MLYSTIIVVLDSVLLDILTLTYSVDINLIVSWCK